MATVLTHLVSVDDEHFPGRALVRVRLADGTTALIEDKQHVLGLDGQHVGDLVPLDCQVQEAGAGDPVTIQLLHYVETTDGRNTLVVTRDRLR
jgi:hypothetical protein